MFEVESSKFTLPSPLILELGTQTHEPSGDCDIMYLAGLVPLSVGGKNPESLRAIATFGGVMANTTMHFMWENHGEPAGEIEFNVQGGKFKVVPTLAPYPQLGTLNLKLGTRTPEPSGDCDIVSSATPVSAV